MPDIITLCVYAQQGNAFSCIGLCISWYMWPKIDLFSALPFKKIQLSVLYYLLVEFEYLQSDLVHPASCIQTNNSCMFY